MKKIKNMHLLDLCKVFPKGKRKQTYGYKRGKRRDKLGVLDLYIQLLMETVTEFIFLGSKIIADGDCNHEIKRRLFLGRK